MALLNIFFVEREDICSNIDLISLSSDPAEVNTELYNLLLAFRILSKINKILLYRSDPCANSLMYLLNVEIDGKCCPTIV